MARILLVNDEPDLVDLCRMVLQEWGHEVEALVHGRGVPEKVLGLQPDLVILDWNLGDTTAEHVIPALRLQAETAKIPILVMSALADGPFMARLYGADAFLRKPFTEEALLSSVENIIHSQRSGVRDPTR